MKAKKRKPVTYLPAFLDIHGKKCIVVGGGKVALRKVKILLDCGANVTVISPTLHPDLAQLVNKKALHRISREYKSGDLGDAVIVIAATDVKEINDQATDEAKRLGALVNVVDDPEPSDFIIPSFFRRKDLTIAVSTSGMSPALAKKIRTTLEEKFGEEYALLLSLIGEVRTDLKRQGIIVSPEVWQRAIDLDLLSGFLRSGERKKAKAFLLTKLKAPKGKK
ncbi:MAG: bifunctional precorrin-2 dehydrogenase/sirohydrochlorin ferrochelatase [Thermodesulfobacteriota bacterium]